MKHECLRLVAIVGGVWCALIVFSQYVLGATVSFPFLTGLFGVAIVVYGFRGISAGCASNYFGDSFAHARTRALLRGQVLTIIASSILLVSYVGWVTALGMIVLFPAGVYVLAMTLRFQSVMPRVPYVLGGRIYPGGYPFLATIFWGRETIRG
ncbi:membrane protein [sediment metagenome]|uniref:Membrane protein n=1 Tax=sediment metagenome TaxID=749907 RepID=D9PKQ6_9ZZZZ